MSVKELDVVQETGLICDLMAKNTLMAIRLMELLLVDTDELPTDQADWSLLELTTLKVEDELSVLRRAIGHPDCSLSLIG